MSDSERTVIAILMQGDSKNNKPYENLKRILLYAYENKKDYLEKFFYVISKKAYDLLSKEKIIEKNEMSNAIQAFLNSESFVVLPSYKEDGGMILNWLIVQKYISLTWSFMTPNSDHLYSPFTDTFIRLCDVWNVKKYITNNAIIRWFLDEFESDIERNLQFFPPKIQLRKHLDENDDHTTRDELYFENFEKISKTIQKNQSNFDAPPPVMKIKENTIALVVELPLVDKLVDLVMMYEDEFFEFEHIITTNNIGQILREKVPSLTEKIYEYHSAPRGGFVEISTEIILGTCDVLVFLTDPLQVQPYRQDTKLVFNSCLLSNTIKVITNESHAKEWLERTARTAKLYAKHQRDK